MSTNFISIVLDQNAEKIEFTSYELIPSKQSQTNDVDLDRVAEAI